MPDFEKLRESANQASTATQRLVDTIGVLEQGLIPRTDEPISAPQRARINTGVRAIISEAQAALVEVITELNRP